MPRPRLLVAMFVLIAAGLPTVGRAAVHEVDVVIGDGSVVGTIRTDGTLGMLSSENILDWELALTTSEGTFVLEGPDNSVCVVFGDALHATESGLTFDFFAESPSLVIFQNPELGSGRNYWCLDSAIGACAGTPSSMTVGLVDGAFDQTDLQTGAVEFATLPGIECPSDVGGDGDTGTSDLIALLAGWGDCPGNVFEIAFSIDIGGVAGTIETDGTLGALATANIVDWDLVLTTPEGVTVLDGPANSEVSVGGSGFVATPTGLEFDFDATDGSFVAFQRPFVGAGNDFVCLNDATGACSGDPSSITVLTDFGVLVVIPRSEVVQVCSAAPPPCPGDIDGDGTVGTSDLIALLAGWGPCPVPSFTYQVDRALGSDGFVTGFIETDGTLGTLTADDIVDWDLSLTTLFGTAQLDGPAGSALTIVGEGLRATETAIVFDFATDAGWYVQFGSSGGDYWCLNDEGGACSTFARAEAASAADYPAVSIRDGMVIVGQRP